MTKKRSLFLPLLLIQIITFGQVKLSKDFLVTVGTPYDVIDAKSKEYFYDDHGHAILVKTDGEKVSIQRYDIGTMKELSRKEYEDFPPYNKIQKVIKLGDKLFYIFSSFDKKEKKEDIYSRAINMGDGTFETAKLLFSTAKEATVSSYGEAAVATLGGIGIPIRFEVLSSSDDSKILIRYRLKPEERDDAKNYDVLGFFVFDANMQKQWGGEIKMPYTEKVMNNLAYAVNKEGKAFMLAYLNERKEFELFTIGNDQKLKTNKIALDAGLMFQSINMKETADGNLNCAGFYANGVDFKVDWFGGANLSFNTNGILNFKIDQTGKVLEKANVEFPLALINQYESGRQQEKNEKRESEGKAGIADLKITDISWGQDGSTIIIGEQQYVRKSYYGTRPVTNFYFADVVATKIDKTGKVLWMKKLPKTQFGQQGKGGMGIRFIKGKGAEYILFLDNIKNANLKIDDVPDRHQDGKGGFLTAFKIDDATGAIERHSIFDITDIKGTEAYQFRAPRIFDASNNTFVLEVYIKGKEDTMIKMEFAK